MLTLKLKAKEDRRLRAGHLWVFSNELEAGPDYKLITPGSLCRVEDSRGKPLGTGYINPRTLLAVRLLTGDADANIDVDWFIRRVEHALRLREVLYPTPHYRLIHAEADGLPGLVVDRYGEVLCAQFTTAGMENLKPLVIAALQTVLNPKGIFLRNDSGARELEGLNSYTEDVGEVPDQVEVLESGVRFLAPLKVGQKTGWFFDQHDNRDRLARYAKDSRVLDVFSYAGGWAVRAHAFGAAEVSCVDSSQTALDAATANAQLNRAKLAAHKGDALDVMKALRAEGRQYDVIVVDPPALIKKKKDYEAGLEHYAALNRAAMQLLPSDGVLISCSCSHHLEEEALQRILLREARSAHRRLQILERGGAGPDHPVHPAIPETRYLKAFFCRVSA